MPHVNCGKIKTAYEVVACLNVVLHYRLLAPLAGSPSAHDPAKHMVTMLSQGGQVCSSSCAGRSARLDVRAARQFDPSPSFSEN